MAITCYASSSTSFTLTSPSPKPYPAPVNKSPFLGFPVAAAASPFSSSKFRNQPLPLSRTNRNSFQIRCEDKTEKTAKTAFIPVDQRWMFEDTDFKGPDIWNTTWYPKGEDHVNTQKTWYIVDATDKILGRLASTVAIHIRGKNLPTFCPSVDMGAYVIVINAENIAVSGKKRNQKLYRRHSGRPGGMTVETFDQLQQRIPERIIEHAVRGMLPKGRLGRQLFTHLKVYKGPNHPHEAQKPIDLPIRDKRIQKQN